MAETIRRSGRAKRQTISVYDDAKKLIDERESIFKSESRQKAKVNRKGNEESDGEKSDDGSDDDTTDSASEEAPESEVETESEERDEDVVDKQSSIAEGEDTPRKEKKQSPPKKSIAATVKNRIGNKIQIKVRGEKSNTNFKATKSKSSSPTTKRGSQNALATLAKKVLEAGETEDNSLVAALLTAYKVDNLTGSDSKSNKFAKVDNRTIYTAQLERIARKVVLSHREDTNKAQINLLNLLFRSVGGTVDTNIDNNTILEDMDSEQWGQVVTDLVDDMRYTPVDLVLLCADPGGAVHAAALDGKPDDYDIPIVPSAHGVREFRKIYEEFWFVLGTIALSEGYARVRESKYDDDDSDALNSTTPTNTGFDTEVTRDLILRVSELVTVGQPDVRAAAMIAAMQMGLAVLNRTAEVKAKLEVATRQFNVAKACKSGSRKAEGLANQMNTLKRKKEDLEELVVGNIMQGVFMHRYRDTNMHIRAFALQSLSKMTLIRPDIFLGDKYLKYFGWMLSDKCACVRQAAISGLAAPFNALAERATDSSRSIVATVDVDKMQNVLSKFLLRLIDCVIDVNINVQEKAMALLLVLERKGFMDEIEDDQAWSQINVRALASDTSTLVRRDALYFVIEQLETWDVIEPEQSQDINSKRWARDKNASLVQSKETAVVQKLGSLASWVAHSLTNGDIPIDKIRVELADYVVQSLRAMPEHKAIVTNWSAILRAIGDDNTTATQEEGNRTEVAKQRVLVQMLASAVQAEIGSVVNADYLHGDLDKDVVEALKVNNSLSLDASAVRKTGLQRSSGMSHEALSTSLLQALPGLMIRFKTDTSILGSITILPKFLLPTVFSLPQRKNDFITIIKMMTEIFFEASDDTVLSNIAQSLKFLVEGEHVRARDVHLQLQGLTSRLSERLVDLFDQRFLVKVNENPDHVKNPKTLKKTSSERTKRSSRGSYADVAADEIGATGIRNFSEACDSEYSIYLCIKRFRIISKRICIVDLFERSKPLSLANLCNKVVEEISNRLKNRRVVTSDNDNNHEPTFIIPDVWTTGSLGNHSVVSMLVAESLDFLLAVTLWSRKAIMYQDDDESEEDIVDLPVVKLRDEVIALVSLCFEQYLPLNDGDTLEGKYSEEHITFSNNVQSTAGQVMSDLRALFPREWADATSPSLRAMALTEDQHLAAGFVRYFRSMEESLRLAETEAVTEDVDLVRKMFLPFARSLATNWRSGNRREAGYALAHITGSGPEASKIVCAMVRVVKKIDPVRLLETQMACLRTSFEDWLNNEPDEPSSDRPTDKEMAAFDDAERKYLEKFQLMEQQASRLSQSLGVCKLSDSILKTPLLGFVREGVRYSFSTDVPGEEPLMPGSRLTFLSLLCKYASWIRRNKDQRMTLLDDLNGREENLHSDPEFTEVRQDDLLAIDQFRKALGFSLPDPKSASPRSIVTSQRSASDRESDEERSEGSGSTGPSPSSSKNRGRLSHASSVGSARSSRLSITQSSLSPLPEEDGPRASIEDGEELSPSPTKRRKVARSQRLTRSSFGSNRSGSIIGHSATTIEEGSDEEGSGVDSDISDTQMSK